MADFRKCALAVAVLALFLGTAVTAQAQAFNCVANTGVPPLVRGEGLTELTGDIVLNCTGGTAIPGPYAVPRGLGNAPPTVNIQIFLNTNITSRLLADPWNEALLMINEPGPAGPFNTCTSATTFTTPDITNNCNIFQGRKVGENSVLFPGVPVLPPGSTGVTTYRITNIRANASAVAPGGSGTPGQLIALISATPASFGQSAGAVVSPSFPINNPQQIVGFVTNGLEFVVRTAANDGTLSTTFSFQQCVTRNNNNDTNRRKTGFAVLRYTELFPTSFKTRTVQATNTIPANLDIALPVNVQNVPGFIYNSESGYVNPNLGTPLCSALSAGCAGLADYSTRLRAAFTNVPTGVRLFASVRHIGSTTNNSGRLIGSETGAFFPVTALADATYSASGNGVTGGGLQADIAAAEIPIVNGAGTAVWEIMSQDPLTAGRVEFGVFASYVADVANNVPASPSQASISGSFAPAPPAISASDGAKSSATLPIPRFVELGSSRNMFRIQICLTNLLFPYVTNQVGFDTGLSIANTSRDPFGTALQTGTCTLNWYGVNAPAAVTTPTVTPDALYVNLASVLAPNFGGYMIAQCRFQYAHGFAFISDVGARNLAMGYLALVIPALSDNTRPADNQGFVPTGTGEVLGN